MPFTPFSFFFFHVSSRKDSRLFPPFSLLPRVFPLLLFGPILILRDQLRFSRRRKNKVSPSINPTNQHRGIQGERFVSVKGSLHSKPPEMQHAATGDLIFWRPIKSRNREKTFPLPHTQSYLLVQVLQLPSGLLCFCCELCRADLQHVCDTQIRLQTNRFERPVLTQNCKITTSANAYSSASVRQEPQGANQHF